MTTVKTEAKTEKKKITHTWKPLFNLLKVSRVPIYYYVIYLVVSLAFSTVYVLLPSVKAQIIAGEIFDPSLVVTYVAVTLASTLLSFPLSFFSVYISYNTQRCLRRTIWSKIIHLPMKDLDEMPPTTLVSRVTTDTENIDYTISYVINMVLYVYYLVSMLAIVGGVNTSMMIMMALLIPCIIIANIPSHFMHNAQYEITTANANYTNYLAEHLGSLKQIKASAAEKKEDAANDAAAKACFKAKVKMAVLDMLAQPLIYGMDAVVDGIILIYGGYLLSQGILTTESLLTVYMYGSIIAVYSYQFVFCWQNVKQTQGGTKAISEIIMKEPEKMERKRTFDIPDADITLENVTFSYNDGEKVLDDVSMTFPKGKVTAIVGPSGSGKTTVLKLLERLYQPDDGKIMFGDIEAETIHLNEWRAAFGMVPQSSPLLFGTVRDNITYGVDEGVSDEALKSAMDAANVTELVDKMPQGLDTDVGDVGSKLSGGEKQRIALARMMIRDPEYLLLDEATSSLDALNESHVVSALGKLMEGRTTVVVAHNLRTVENADNIIFLENGKVTGSGTHKELYESNATYKQYVNLQKQEQRA
ncbi:MAG: ABC transporter ATP-binding protein/permease [Oscillospiraceae bacterium]|nr:ABC transporter ATP-binding protein/permease [Oscillospiraceae bacterium]